MTETIIPETKDRKEIDLLSYNFTGFATCVHHKGDKLPQRGMFAKYLNHHLPPLPANWVWVCKQSSDKYSDWRLETLCDYEDTYDTSTRQEYTFERVES